MQLRKGRFTVAEEAVLLQKYALIPLFRLAASLYRSPSSVKRRAIALFEEQPMRTGTWSPEDIARLKTYYGSSPDVPLQLVLRREPKDIESAVARLRKRAKGRTEPLTRPEIGAFKRWYGNRTLDDLSVVFERESEMLEELAKTLCLSKDKAFIRRTGGTSKMPRWTTAEVERLGREYPEKSNTDLARDFGRSVKSIVSKAHNLGLKKTSDRLREMGRQNVRGRYEK